MKISNLRTDTVVENPDLNEIYKREKTLIKRNFIESFIYTFCLYSNYHGRTSRKDYWPFIIIYVFFSFILHGIGLGTTINIPLLIYQMVFFLPLLTNTIRRIHDTRHSGWFIFIPFINIYLLLKKGYKGKNQYGSDPLFE